MSPLSVIRVLKLIELASIWKVVVYSAAYQRKGYK